MHGMRGRRRFLRSAPCWGKAGSSGSTDQKGARLKKYSLQSPPEIVTHGVPTQDAKNANPVWGERSASQVARSATWFQRPMSAATSTLGQDRAIRSRSRLAKPAVDVRPVGAVVTPVR